MQSSRERYLYKIFTVALLFIVGGCSDNSSSPSGPATVTLTIESIFPDKIFNNYPTHNIQPGRTVDSITISRVRLLLRNIILRSSKDSIVFASQPLVVEIGSAGKPATIEMKNITAGKYYSIDVNIHKPEKNADSLPEYSHVSFVEFLEGPHHSAIVDGTVYDQFSKTNFTFKSRGIILSRLQFSPLLTISPSSSITIALTVDILSCFKQDSTGLTLDPLDGDNENEINYNLANSIRVK